MLPPAADLLCDEGSARPRALRRGVRAALGRRAFVAERFRAARARRRARGCRSLADALLTISRDELCALTELRFKEAAGAAWTDYDRGTRAGARAACASVVGRRRVADDRFGGTAVEEVARTALGARARSARGKRARPAASAATRPGRPLPARRGGAPRGELGVDFAQRVGRVHVVRHAVRARRRRAGGAARSASTAGAGSRRAVGRGARRAPSTAATGQRGGLEAG